MANIKLICKFVFGIYTEDCLYLMLQQYLNYNTAYLPLKLIYLKLNPIDLF